MHAHPRKVPGKAPLHLSPQRRREWVAGAGQDLLTPAGAGAAASVGCSATRRIQGALPAAVGAGAANTWLERGPFLLVDIPGRADLESWLGSLPSPALSSPRRRAGRCEFGRDRPRTAPSQRRRSPTELADRAGAQWQRREGCASSRFELSGAAPAWIARHAACEPDDKSRFKIEV